MEGKESEKDILRLRHLEQSMHENHSSSSPMVTDQSMESVSYGQHSVSNFSGESGLIGS